MIVLENNPEILRKNITYYSVGDILSIHRILWRVSRTIEVHTSLFLSRYETLKYILLVTFKAVCL